MRLFGTYQQSGGVGNYSEHQSGYRVAMPSSEDKQTRGSAEAKAWALDVAGRVGRTVAAIRRSRDFTALQLATRTAELGYPLTRGTISRIEGNLRAGKLDLAEIVVLSAALEVTPLQLVYPPDPALGVEYLPGVECPSIIAALTFSGERNVLHSYDGENIVLRLARRWAALSREIRELESQAAGAVLDDDEIDALLPGQSRASRLARARKERDDLAEALTRATDYA